MGVGCSCLQRLCTIESSRPVTARTRLAVSPGFTTTNNPNYEQSIHHSSSPREPSSLPERPTTSPRILTCATMVNQTGMLGEGKAQEHLRSPISI